MTIKSLIRGLTIGTGSVMLMLGTASGISRCSVQREQEKMRMEGLKNIVKDEEPYFYQYLETRGEKDLDVWSDAVKELEIEREIEYKCRKAYFEGAQMVRDSIANANLKNTAKKAVKVIK